jgi:two-component sensor histidine kinase
MRNLFFLFLFSAHLTFSFGQVTNGLIGHYYFNEGDTKNDVGLPAKPVGVYFSEDRFGNPKSCCSLNGSNQSYLNLGTDPVFKTPHGSISIWLKLSGEVYAGSGAKFNPFMLVKNRLDDDFFEAYSIYYNIPLKKIGVCCSLSELNQINVFMTEKTELEKWYHIVMTYDDRAVCLYVNGKLENRADKNFRTQFLSTDSVMIGNSANIKNNRFLLGSVDDISIYNRVLTPDEIAELYNEPDPNRTHNILKFLFRIFISLTLILIITGFIRYKFRKELAKEKEKSDLQRQVYEMEMKVIKAQMNPHFIFNSMNSIQQYILKDDTEKANAYLVKFSRLLRRILESNSDENISIENEIDLLTRYIEIESSRFSNAFAFEIISEDRLSGSLMRIPQMLVQPFVENAIWHGLLPKKDEKKLKVQFEYVDEKTIACTIEDNGVGRNSNKKNEPLTKHKSLGIHFTEQRLELMKKEWGGNYRVTITDLLKDDGSAAGTRVYILIPLIHP